MAEQLTCGQGLAANAPLPAKLGALAEALADVLDKHTTALDLEDDRAQQERVVYVDVVEELRASAACLNGGAERMAAAESLPPARHLPHVLASPELEATFARFVALEEELLTMLQRRLDEDRAMLGGAGDA